MIYDNSSHRSTRAACRVCAFAYASVSAILLANLEDTEKKIVQPRRSDARREVHLASGGRRPVDQRSLHAHRGRELHDPGRASGVKPPAGLTRDMEKTVTDKAKVVEHV